MTIRVSFAVLAFSFVSLVGCATARQTQAVDMVAKLRECHIAANAPPDADFAVILQRDVRAYLVANNLPSEKLQIEPLRQGPTQSGISFPKYYLWIEARDQAGQHVKGAMQVAAIERVRFDITDFTQVESVRSDPELLDAIYPAALIPAIRRRAETE